MVDAGKVSAVAGVGRTMGLESGVLTEVDTAADRGSVVTRVVVVGLFCRPRGGFRKAS